jgi:hypothetical protein
MVSGHKFFAAAVEVLVPVKPGIADVLNNGHSKQFWGE